MLDQNTDRMWYVIGAVIVGAAIILIMNKTFPQLFASVGDTFKSKTEQTTTLTDGIGPKSIVSLDDDVFIYSGSTGIYERTATGHRLSTNTEYPGEFFGIGVRTTHFTIGKKYVLRFTLTKFSGTLDYIGGHANGFTTDKVVINGETYHYEWHDPKANTPSFNYANGEYTVEVYLTYDGDYPVDNQLYIQPNRRTSASEYDLEISNLMLQKGW